MLVNSSRNYALLQGLIDHLEEQINSENDRLKKSITWTDMDEPEWHDYQTCGELQELLQKECWHYGDIKLIESACEELLSLYEDCDKALFQNPYETMYKIRHDLQYTIKQ